MNYRRMMWMTIAVLLLGTALYFRSAGLFRGLKSGYVFNPDAPKQVAALEQFLNDREIWYTDNVFYDGYPLFLNHVDAWIIKPIHRLCMAIDACINPSLEIRTFVPSRAMLYYLGLSLRVMYGLILILLAFHCARRMGFPRPAATLVALLIALHALSITVTRSVTGDIGVDLFSALMLIGLCRGAANPSRILPWLFMGMMLAFAFTAKYHGILAGWSILLYWLGHDMVSRQNLRMAFRHAVASIVGLAAGLVIALPQLRINPRRTQDDIIRNFAFIKDFKVEASFLDKPFFERAYLGLTMNGPKVIEALGWWLVFFAMLTAITVGFMIFRQRKTIGAIPNELLLKLAIYSLPFVVLLASLMGKPSLQMFHFSWLVLPLSLAAVEILMRGWSRGGIAAICAMVGGGLLIFQTVRASAADLRFWRHEDNGTIAFSLDRNLTKREPSAVPKQIVRIVRLENGNFAGFRNAFNSVRVPNGGLWHRLAIAPIPSTPYPEAFHWIFMNGPVFPRNDRVVVITSHTPARRELVFNGKPGPLWIGLQAGNLPVEIRLKLGGTARRERLAANSHTIFSVQPDQYRELTGSADDPGGALRCFVPMEASTQLGDAWITLMMTEAERSNFLMFGGTPDPKMKVSSTFLDTNTLNTLIEKAFYIEGDGGFCMVSNKADYVFCKNIPLAAGVYELRYDAIPLDPEMKWTMSVTSESQVTPLIEQPIHTIAGDEKRIRSFSHVFSKTFTPYQVTLSINCPTGACRIGKWQLKPLASRITSDIARYETDGIRADWMHQAPAGYLSTTNGPCSGIQFGKAIELVDFNIPRVLPARSPTPVTCAMRLRTFPFPHRHFEDYLVFLHFKTPQSDEIKGVIHIPLTPALASEKMCVPMILQSPDLPAGRYEVWMGLYNMRTRKRLDIGLPVVMQSRFPVASQKIMIAKVAVHE